MRRCLWAVAAAATATGLAPAGSAVAGAAAPGTRLWVARFGGGGIRSGAMAVSPHGSRVFVAGASYGGRATGLDYKTVAYSGVTGRQVWARLYRGPGHREDLPAAVAVSPGGAAVFVTGYAPGWGTDYDYATVRRCHRQAAVDQPLHQPGEA